MTLTPSVLPPTLWPCTTWTHLTVQVTPALPKGLVQIRALEFRLPPPQRVRPWVPTPSLLPSLPPSSSKSKSVQQLLAPAPSLLDPDSGGAQCLHSMRMEKGQWVRKAPPGQEVHGVSPQEAAVLPVSELRVGPGGELLQKVGRQSRWGVIQGTAWRGRSRSGSGPGPGRWP